MWMTLIIFALYKRQRDDWCNGSTATTRWYRFLIVVGGGSSPSSSPIDYFWIWLEAQRCLYAVFYSVWHLSEKTGSYLVSINILLMFLHNCCSSSVKIGCTIRICSSTVEHLGRPFSGDKNVRLVSDPRRMKVVSIILVLNTLWLTLLARRWSYFNYLVLFFSFVRSVREYRAH